MPKIPAIDSPQTVLVANRGEIARRIIRSCRALGYTTIAVYDLSDAQALHRFEADCAVELPWGDATYINQEALLTIAKAHGVTAIHPGYGFLSENAEFAARVRDADMVFIGPSPATIRSVGDKQAARELATSLQIPVLQGVTLSECNQSQALARVKKLGYPIMLKSTLAGGGRGMRRVYSNADFTSAFEQVQAEARLFGAGNEIIAERLLDSARHIEVQLCGFADGSIVHLGERDCSAQRRFQKLIEEAPATGIPPQRIEEIRSAALNLGAKAELLSLATVEFLCTDENFYFLEVNPRLQVEHPITELITGLDLVSMQMRACLENDFAVAQDEISFTGNAIEVRIVAETPEQAFLPSNHVIEFLRLPEKKEHPGLRVEHSLSSHQKPNLAYDSLLAKICCHADTFQNARNQLREILADTEILGPSTTLRYLYNALNSDSAFSIFSLEQMHEDLIQRAHWQVYYELATVACFSAEYFAYQHQTPFSDFPRFARSPSFSRTYQVESDAILIEPQPVTVQLIGHRESILELQVSERKTTVKCNQIDPLHFHCGIRDAELQLEARVLLKEAPNLRATVGLYGYTFWFSHQAPQRIFQGDAMHVSELCAPLPGTVRTLHVVSGQVLQKGEPLITLESMKMEHVLKASKEVTISKVCAVPGQRVDKGQVLLVYQ